MENMPSSKMADQNNDFIAKENCKFLSFFKQFVQWASFRIVLVVPMIFLVVMDNWTSVSMDPAKAL